MCGDRRCAFGGNLGLLLAAHLLSLSLFLAWPIGCCWFVFVGVGVIAGGGASLNCLRCVWLRGYVRACACVCVAPHPIVERSAQCTDAQCPLAPPQLKPT